MGALQGTTDSQGALSLRLKKLGLLGGCVAAALSLSLMLFAPGADPNAPLAKGSSCRHELKGTVEGCTDTVSMKSGNVYAWTVEKAGRYTVQVSPPSGKKYPLFAELAVVDATGATLANVEADDMGKPATSETLALQPGTYTLKVKDFIDRDLKGGFGYSLAISGTEAVAEPTQAEAEAPAKTEVKVAPALNGPKVAAAKPAAKVQPRVNSKKAAH